MAETATKPLAYSYELAEFCAGNGQHHSDQAEKNARPYDAITWEEITRMMQTPPSVAKGEAQWAIFSTLATRGADKQRSGGCYHALWSDLDETTTTLTDAVHKAATAIPGDVYGYASKSATEAKQKGRLLFPLSEPCTGVEFEILQEILNDRLHSAGLIPDRVTERANQLCFLPNRGEFYTTETLDFNGPLDWRVEFADEIKAKREEIQREEEALKAAQEEARRKRQERLEIQQNTGIISPVDTFNDQYSIKETWESYGARWRGRRGVSPNSSSGSPAITVNEEAGLWYSFHHSDKDIGQPGAAGGTWGDAFDLFVHFGHKGNYAAAVKAAGEMFNTPEGVTINKHNQRLHEQAKAREKAAQEFEGMGEWWRNSGSQDASQPSGQEVAQNAPELPHESEPDENHSNTAPSLLDALDKYKARHLLDTTPPPQRYVVDGLIPEPVTAAIVAPGSTGKSFWLMQLAACVCSGVPFMGQAIPNPGAVLMLGAEDDRDEMSRRLHSIVHEYRFAGCPLDEKAIGERFYAVSRVGESNLLTYMDGRNIVRMDGKNDRPDNIGEIVKAAQAIPDLRLIILDPISRFRAGDENDNEAATRFVEALEQIRKETGVTVLCAHHSRKGSDGKDADSIRGASALVDAFRFAATLAKIRPDEAKKMRMDESEVKSLVHFNVVKSNYRTDVDEMWLRRGVGGVLRPTDAPEQIPSGAHVKAEERYETTLKKLRELVRQKDEDGKPLTRSKLKREYGGTSNVFGIGRDTLADIANRAIDEGKLFVREDDGTLHLY